MSGRPIIGITSYAQPARWGAWELPAALVPLHYVESVERAGGRALLVPPSTDGVVLVGRLRELRDPDGIPLRHQDRSQLEFVDAPPPQSPDRQLQRAKCVTWRRGDGSRSCLNETSGSPHRREVGGGADAACHTSGHRARPTREKQQLSLSVRGVMSGGV